jgi:tetratricopeptide (TPR) repeat protein
MRRFISISAVVLSLLAATAAMAQVRGTGRMQGNIVDKKTGKPIVGATVTLAPARESTQPIVVKTDNRGHWAAIGLTSGQWNIDIAAPGYATSRGTANVSEVQAMPPIKTALDPETTQEAPAAAAPTSPLIPKEAIDAIKEGQDLLHVKVGDTVSNPPGATAVSHTVTADEAKDNAKRAVADFEKALPMIPEDKPETKTIKNQLNEVLAQAYYRAGKVKNAIATLEALNVTDPWTTPDANQTLREVLLANLYLEDGQLDKGKAILDKLPASAITDPTAYINIGILFLNKRNPADATGYFTKAIGLDAKSADGYYYRGLAYAQQRKIPEARADFQQVVTLAPDSSEAKDAKQMLDGLPKK